MTIKQKRRQFSVKGVPDYWDELKQRYTMALTPTAIANLDASASQLEISRSELVELLARNIEYLPLEVITLRVEHHPQPPFHQP